MLGTNLFVSRRDTAMVPPIAMVMMTARPKRRKNHRIGDHNIGDAACYQCGWLDVFEWRAVFNGVHDPAYTNDNSWDTMQFNMFE